MQNERLVPLSDVAYELNVSTRDLERRCATGLVTDELGMRCVAGGLVRELIAKRDAERAAQHQRRVADQQEAQRQKEARRRERERLDRLHEKQAPLDSPRA